MATVIIFQVPEALHAGYLATLSTYDHMSGRLPLTDYRPVWSGKVWTDACADAECPVSPEAALKELNSGVGCHSTLIGKLCSISLGDVLVIDGKAYRCGTRRFTYISNWDEARRGQPDTPAAGFTVTQVFSVTINVWNGDTVAGITRASDGERVVVTGQAAADVWDVLGALFDDPE